MHGTFMPKGPTRTHMLNSVLYVCAKVSHSWWQSATGDSQLGGGHPSGALVVAWLVLPKVADE